MAKNDCGLDLSVEGYKNHRALPGLVSQRAAGRRRVLPRLWRWLAVAEGLWGQVVAAMVCSEFQEKPLQDELR